MSTTTSNISKSIQTSALVPALFSAVGLLGTLALASVVSLVDITPAWSATPTERSVTVSFRDLDLSRPADAKALYGRIQAAAKLVCGYAGADLIEQEIWRGCYRTAISNAVTKVNSPLLTAVHTGRPAPMTAMLK